MAELDQNSTGTNDGAGDSITPKQDAEQTSQDDGQGQTLDTGGQVDTSGGNSSSGDQGRAKKNSFWANQRQLEKVIEKNNRSLEERITALIETRLAQIPSAPKGSTDESQKNLIDYNDLDGSINRIIEMRMKERLEKELPKTLQGVTTKLEVDRKRQEAKNFLISEKDILGKDEIIAEIQKIMDENYLSDAFDRDPLGVTKHAVKLWRTSRTNPNTPSVQQLSTVTGVTVNNPRQPVPIEKLREIQKKLGSQNLTIEEQEGLEKQVDSLTAQLA